MYHNAATHERAHDHAHVNITTLPSAKPITSYWLFKDAFRHIADNNEKGAVKMQSCKNDRTGRKAV